MRAEFLEPTGFSVIRAVEVGTPEPTDTVRIAKPTSLRKGSNTPEQGSAEKGFHWKRGCRWVTSEGSSSNVLVRKSCGIMSTVPRMASEEASTHVTMRQPR